MQGPDARPVWDPPVRLQSVDALRDQGDGHGHCSQAWGYPRRPDAPWPHT